MGCFLIGVTGQGYTATGESLLGSVSDDPYDIRTFLKLVQPSNSLRHIGTELISTTEHTLTERGYFARLNETTRGVNEAGLAFTCAMIFEDESAKKLDNPIYFGDITTHMMNHCKTVSEAIELFKSKGVVNPPYSILLADADGDLAHLEVGNFGIAVNHHYTKKEPGVVFAVNCYLSQQLKNFNASNAVITDKNNNNNSRRERGIALEEKFQGRLDVERLVKILSDHAHRDRDPMNNPLLHAWGYSICNHGTRRSETYPHEDLPWGTVSAEILQPAAKTFWYCYGWPCGEKPEYGDQIFQDKSWGKFLPFSFTGKPQEKEITHLTTPSGEITLKGKKEHVL